MVFNDFEYDKSLCILEFYQKLDVQHFDTKSKDGSLGGVELDGIDEQSMLEEEIYADELTESLDRKVFYEFIDQKIISGNVSSTVQCLSSQSPLSSM